MRPREDSIKIVRDIAVVPGSQGPKVPKNKQKFASKQNSYYLRIKYIDMNSLNDNIITWNLNYKRLLCYQKTVAIYDLTYHFCNRYISNRDRTYDQMIQAARSGKQNIVEGYGALATSKESGIKLFNVARASLLELYEDYNDYLRVRDMRIWEPESNEAKTMAKLGVEKNDSRYFISLAENRSDEVVANMTIILIRQAISLIHRYLDRVSENFANEGGFKERMTRVRLNVRNKNNQ